MTADLLLKAEAAGNDFVIGLGGWAKRLAADAGLVRWLCDRRRGIGADGVLALTPRPDGVEVVHRNADASCSAFCANGSRCAALAACHELGLGERVLLMTGWGPIPATVRAAGVSLELPAPASPPRWLVLDADGTRWQGVLVTIGVPHLVIEVDDPAALDLARIGPVLRRHPALGPDGANVHLVAGRDAGEIRIRSFERGVEAETWCCGSGVVATALVALAARGTTEAALCCRGGDRLTVVAHGTPPVCPSELTGPARLVAVVEPRLGATGAVPAEAGR